ncbi:hypothetical protein PILCRDRAFT_646815 [Piloderma croceum F 1598]|uniref:Uncharacterized protein n=1 Tax=Piloderma croceum (strain F 1598) TaxID=765440 RepID=A0A0C3F9G0_PILCF|nr:hypothetical protein PILCRDRAFT_646815 [Piloderma croceum F 1598]
MVALLCLHLALVTTMMYHYTVTNWGDVTVLIRTTWSLKVQIIIATVLVLIAQCFFARRIWRLSGKNWVPTALIVLLPLCQLGEFGFRHYSR